MLLLAQILDREFIGSWLSPHLKVSSSTWRCSLLWLMEGNQNQNWIDLFSSRHFDACSLVNPSDSNSTNSHLILIVPPGWSFDAWLLLSRCSPLNKGEANRPQSLLWMQSWSWSAIFALENRRFACFFSFLCTLTGHLSLSLWHSTDAFLQS